MAALPGGAGPALAGRNAVPVLLFHRISTAEHPLPLDDETIDLTTFSQEMQYLHEHGYHTMGTADLVSHMRSGSDLPPHAVLIHFDDGRRSVLNALPALNRYGFKATFWIIVGRVGLTDYLDWDEIATLNQIYEVYSHTMTHSWHGRSDLLNWAEGKVPGKGMADVDWELQESKRVLEARLGRPVPYLAWPFGAYSDALIEAGRDAGYEGLFTVDWGLNETGGDVLRIHRSFVSGLCGIAVFERVLQDGHSRTCDAAQARASQ